MKNSVLFPGLCKFHLFHSTERSGLVPPWHLHLCFSLWLSEPSPSPDCQPPLLLSTCVPGDVQQRPALVGSTLPQLLRMPLCFSAQPLGLVGCPKTSTTCSHDLWQWVGMREPQGSAVSKNCSKSPEHLLSLLVFRVRIYILAIFFLDR